ncbi:hypothetical protein C1H46_004223 [Malus baccata]|uniref:Uncharacterized protein n=1 Tax=Malus baccata TaxID=106549 RepID=A0A540NGK1_MALBA|nr:hypothetical protein C1H46_004223 [Malus baccata]
MACTMSATASFDSIKYASDVGAFGSTTETPNVAWYGKPGYSSEKDTHPVIRLLSVERYKPGFGGSLVKDRLNFVWGLRRTCTASAGSTEKHPISIGMYSIC